MATDVDGITKNIQNYYESQIRSKIARLARNIQNKNNTKTAPLPLDLSINPVTSQCA